MLLSILSLVLMLMLIRFVIWVIRSFWRWLGRGKELQQLVDEERVDPDVRDSYNDLQAWRVARHTRDQVAREAPSRLTWKQIRGINKAVDAARDEYLETMKLTAFQVVMIFFVCSILGLVLEELWMLASAGIFQSRVGLVWGPFSPLYGFGGVFLTLVWYWTRKFHAKNWQIFLVSVVVGGLLEQITGWSMETLFHAQSWTYLGLPDAITQWVAWRFLVAWGFIGLLWSKVVMPEMLYRIGFFSTKRQAVFITLLAVYLTADLLMTLACFNRKTARDNGIPPQTAFDAWVDENFTDEFIADRFQNLAIGYDLAPNG